MIRTDGVVSYLVRSSLYRYIFPFYIPVFADWLSYRYRVVVLLDDVTISFQVFKSLFDLFLGKEVKGILQLGPSTSVAFLEKSGNRLHRAIG